MAHGCDLAWTSVVGVDQRGRWRLREPPEGVTRVELRLAYGVAGSGLFGWLAEHVAAPTVRGHLRRSLQQLKRQVEHEQRAPPGGAAQIAARGQRRGRQRLAERKLTVSRWTMPSLSAEDEGATGPLPRLLGLPREGVMAGPPVEEQPAAGLAAGSLAPSAGRGVDS